MPAEDERAGYEIVQGLVSGCATWCFLADKAMNPMGINQRPTRALVGYTHGEAKPKSDSDSDCLVIKAQPA